jgi:3-hydroxyacyl-CoA dehydrogenase/enoyl-CoA hydratase/3-hydroxybutyryl-CoA epimerase
VLDAPPRNEMGQDFFRTLAALIGTLKALSVRGLVVHGAGRHFSSGADIDALKAGLAGAQPDLAKSTLFAATSSFQALAELPYPTIAAVGGCCLGSGLELALACRWRVAAANAVFALPETSFNLMPGCGGTVRLPALVGRGRAVELLLSGRFVDAAAALEIGLVDAVVDRRDLLPAARRLVERVPA